jgi:hypothetical protein
MGIFEPFPEREKTSPNGDAEYDIPAPGRKGFEERYWLPENIPVLDHKGEIVYIIHHAQDYTAQFLAEKRERISARTCPTKRLSRAN